MTVYAGEGLRVVRTAAADFRTTVQYCTVVATVVWVRD